MRIVNGKKIPTNLISKTLVGTNEHGQTKNLITIDKVDHFDKAGTTASFLRLQLSNFTEGVQDSFFFSLEEDMELLLAFLQTTEAEQSLMNLEMSMIQSTASLNEFIVTVARDYFIGECGYDEVRIV